MSFTKKQNLLFILLLVAMVFLFLVNISLGSVSIPLKEVVSGLLSQEMSKESWEIILWNFRFPKAITAILVGIGLSMSGLLMQTLFRNPLAGPYVLGLSSGASLGVAFVILGTGFLPTFISSFFLSNHGLILASSLGSLLVFMAVLLVSKKLKDTMAILIVGLMFGSFTSAIVSVLSYFTTAEKLQKMLRDSFNIKIVKDWFSDKWQVFNECSILKVNPDNNKVEVKRPDRVMTDGKQMIVIDFKFAAPKEEHKSQVKEYMQLLNDMGYSNIHGYLWHVYSKNIIEIK